MSAALACAVLSSGGTALASDNLQTVLVLHSYHKADWTDSLMEGIESVFGERNDLELRVEYMDTKTSYSPAYLERLAEIYRIKYEKIRFDLILTSDDNALLFALENQERLFQGAPVVFCGVNRYSPDLLADHPNVTGVVEKGDFHDTLKSMEALLPRPSRLAVISDRTRTGLANLENFQGVMSEHFPDWSYELLQDVSFEELEARLVSPEGVDAGLFISFWMDVEERPVTPADLEVAFRASSIPVFGRSEWMMNRGLTGGKVVHGYSQGREAALLGERILDGAPAGSLAVMMDSPNKFIFDYLELEHHGISKEELPAGSLLINRPQPFYAVDKKVAGVLVMFFVITSGLCIVLAVVNSRRKASEQHFRTSEGRYRSLVDNIDLGITLIDDQYRVVMTNTAQGRLLGKPAHEFVGRQCFREFEKRNEPCQHCPGKKAMETGEVSVTETRGIREDGSRIDVRIQAFPLLQDGDRPAGFIEVVEDITSRKKDEKELKEAYDRLKNQNRELRKLDKIKDALISDVSHELKTPVAKHQMYLEVLKSVLDSGGSREEVGSVLRTMEESVRRQQQVIRNILVLSRLEGGGRELKILPVRIDTLVKGIIDDYRDLTGILGIAVDTTFEAVEIKTDGEMLSHVVANLVENAIKYRSSERPRILVDVASDSGRAAIKVEDNGIGMTAEERSRAFDRFFQSIVSKEGIGLGLHISKKIVGHLGGEIELASDGRGQGTVASVIIHSMPG
jgi:PAS domain S-box-containing protein